MYKIDDGADHWVIAATVGDALAVYRESEMAPDAMHGDELPEVFELTPEQAAATPIFDDDPSNQIGTMQSDFERDPSRRYVGCSEW